MRTIILGKEGSQPFPIKADGVSRQHARVTIDETNGWMLEDLDSSNGTYVRDEENGELRRVVKIKITPMSFICLGSDNAKGCSFYARQVLKENYGNFTHEYEYLNEKEDDFDRQIEELEKTVVKQKKLIFLLNILVVIVSLIPSIDSEVRMNMLRIIPTVYAGFAAFYDASSKKKLINTTREKFHYCPNPLCSNKLKSSEIRDMKCTKCKK